MKVFGVELPSNKRVEIALRYVYGIGPYRACVICEKVGISHSMRVKGLDVLQQKAVVDAVNEFKVESDLRSELATNSKRLVAIRAYRGLRKAKGLPSRGQNTRNNAKNAKKFNGKYSF